jgi:hypothetical protein
MIAAGLIVAFFAVPRSSKAAPNHYCSTMFSLAAMSVFLFLSACAKAPAPQPRASLPSQQNVSAPSPDPCAVPNTGQTDARNTVYGPQLRPTDKRCPDYSRGVRPLGADWTWPQPPRPEPEAQRSGGNALSNDILNERLWLRAHGRQGTDIRVPHGDRFR